MQTDDWPLKFWRAWGRPFNWLSFHHSLRLSLITKASLCFQVFNSPYLNSVLAKESLEICRSCERRIVRVQRRLLKKETSKITLPCNQQVNLNHSILLLEYLLAMPKRVSCIQGLIVDYVWWNWAKNCFHSKVPCTCRNWAACSCQSDVDSIPKLFIGPPGSRPCLQRSSYKPVPHIRIICTMPCPLPPIHQPTSS